jgi:uncharacterized protein YecT (DUF1311 family)
MALLCSSAFGQSQGQMNADSRASLEELEKEYRNVYETLFQRLTRTDQDALTLTEAAWVSYRTNECKFETLASAGGSAHPLAETECRLGLTQERMKRLQWLLNCPEGDLSCPFKVKH